MRPLLELQASIAGNPLASCQLVTMAAVACFEQLPHSRHDGCLHSPLESQDQPGAAPADSEQRHYSMHNFVLRAQQDEVENEWSYDDSYSTKSSDKVGGCSLLPCGPLERSAPYLALMFVLLAAAPRRCYRPWGLRTAVCNTLEPPLP